MDDAALRVLVVDDTVIYRRILSDVVNELAGLTLVGTAAHGRLALTKMEHNPVDLVLLDVEMPEMDGLATLDALRKRYPNVGVIMISGANEHAAKNTLLALDKGALDFVKKPEENSPEASRKQLIEQLKPLVRVFITRRNLHTTPSTVASPPKTPVSVQAPPKPAATATERTAPAPARFDVVVVGVSTGGPNALAEFLPGLPATIDVPVLLVQHMPPVFTTTLAEHLNKKCALTVCEARADQAVLPNHVYIAPGGSHMVVRNTGDSAQKKYCIGLNTNPPENSCRPSVDVLFRSVAAQYGGNILAVVLTGMGADGRDGVRAMKRSGCFCITQDEASCIVYGMPQAVVAAGLSDAQVPLSQIAHHVLRALKKE